MSSLSRYKKSGGFYQLLSLIETFGPQKKEKFLEMIEAESPAWARVLRSKMITFERIFGWPDQVIVEIFKNLQPKNQAYAIHGLKEEQKAKIMVFYSPSEKRRMEDLLNEGTPKPEEIASVMVKVVEQCRKMLKNRELHPDKFDPDLNIPEDIESKIEEMAAHDTFRSMSTPGTPGAKSEPAPQVSTMSVTSSFAPSSGGAAGDAAGADVILLQKKVAQLMNENKHLKDELSVAREKLAQIKKIA